MPVFRRLLPCLFLLAAAPASADYSGHPKAQELLTQLAREERFSPEELAAVRVALTQAEKIPKLVEAEQKAAERTETWTTYAAKRVDAPRIENGADFLDENSTWFARAEAQYGVPPAIIAGVLGLETNFGRFTGSARVLDALATQGFDHPTRSAFFFSELREFFVFCRDFKRDPTEALGSYAGAMGWAQFMPSNYRRLAVDFDGDGNRDLWTGADAIGSIARYLVEYDPNRSWHRGEPLAVPAVLEKPLPATVPINTSRTTHTVAELAALGLRATVDLPPGTRVGVVELQLDQGREYWIGLNNFYSVMSYNPRVYYAMTVSLLAQEMARVDAERNIAR
ncbi:lytic murein transglycosylase B [Panacagrimonas perspica]|nr:lytic murein transglycosylase [Panacagrimonas perspica]THD03601.1 lytic murein transglycosylase B [Panacagrimonas perspica]